LILNRPTTLNLVNRDRPAVVAPVTVEVSDRLATLVMTVKMVPQGTMAPPATMDLQLNQKKLHHRLNSCALVNPDQLETMEVPDQKDHQDHPVSQDPQEKMVMGYPVLLETKDQLDPQDTLDRKDPPVMMVVLLLALAVQLDPLAPPDPMDLLDPLEMLEMLVNQAMMDNQEAQETKAPTEAMVTKERMATQDPEDPLEPQALAPHAQFQELRPDTRRSKFCRPLMMTSSISFIMTLVSSFF